AKRRESRDAADAASSLAALGALDIKAARKYLAGSSASELLGGLSSRKRTRNSVTTSASTAGNADTYSDDDEENDVDDNEVSDDEDNVDYDGNRDGDAIDGNGKDGGVLNSSGLSKVCGSLSTASLAATHQNSLSDYSLHHRHAAAATVPTHAALENSPATTLPSIASICDRISTLPPLPSRLPPQQQLFLPPMMLPSFQLPGTPLSQQQQSPLSFVPSTSSLSSLISSSSTLPTQAATSSGSRTLPSTGSDSAPALAVQYYPPPAASSSAQHHSKYHPYFRPQL
ncbi:hypothetical protein IWW57_005949, partial [Coemansia sp. S610]